MLLITYIHLHWLMSNHFQLNLSVLHYLISSSNLNDIPHFRKLGLPKVQETTGICSSFCYKKITNFIKLINYKYELLFLLSLITTFPLQAMFCSIDFCTNWKYWRNMLLFVHEINIWLNKDDNCMLYQYYFKAIVFSNKYYLEVSD